LGRVSDRARGVPGTRRRNPGIGRAIARGRESGIVIDAAAAWIARLRQGKIVGFQSFSNPQNALEAAGLRE
jgi:hypothetical protein